MNRPLIATLVLGVLATACQGTSVTSPASMDEVTAQPSVTSQAESTPSAASTPAAQPASAQPSSPLASETDFRDPVPAIGWREVATFGGTNMVAEATGVTFGGGQFVAVGTHYEWSPGSPGSAEGRIWLSADGESWEMVPSDAVFEHARLTNVITAGDGTLVAYGWAEPLTQMHGAIPVSASWRSADGRRWQRSEFESFAERDALPVDDVAHGRQGYMLRQAHARTLGTGPSGAELWHSLDGLSWELMYETPDESIVSMGAGDEGFAAVRVALDGRAPTVFASADGREWLDGDALPQELEGASLAPLGGDWVMVGRGLEGPPAVPGPVSPGVYELPVWLSANALAWQPVASIRWPGDGLGFAGPGPLVSNGGRLFLTPFAAGAGPRLSSAGVWSSADKTTWETTDIRPDVTIVDGAEHDGTVVLVGYVGPGQSATVWINERP